MIHLSRRTMKRLWFGGLIGLLLIVVACATTPYTRRRQLMLTSSGQENRLGYQAFRQIRREYQPCRDPKINQLVQRVGKRIARAARRPDFRWEFVVFQDKMANAFCLPGGKVGVFTGIFKYTKDEAGLATVLSHEAAHAILRHAGERLSQSLLLQMGGLGLNIALQGKNPYMSRAVQQAYGLGAQLGVILPYSRTQEYEADRVGLILMAKAGYDPAQALRFWERMLASKKQKRQPPEFLSTHPTDANRIREIKRLLPEARRYYRPPQKKTATPPPKTSEYHRPRRTSPLISPSTLWSRHRNRSQH